VGPNEQSARLQESIVEMEVVLGAIAEIRQPEGTSGRKALDVLSGEPVLQEYLSGAILEIAGKMSLFGCPPAAVRCMYREVAFLLATTFLSVRQAHRQLYADLLPQAPVAASDPQAQADESGADVPASDRDGDGGRHGNHNHNHNHNRNRGGDGGADAEPGSGAANPLE